MSSGTGGGVGGWGLGGGVVGGVRAGMFTLRHLPVVTPIHNIMLYIFRTIVVRNHVEPSRFYGYHERNL